MLSLFSIAFFTLLIPQAHSILSPAKLQLSQILSEIDNDNSTSRSIDYSIVFQGVTKTTKNGEEYGQPKETSSEEVLRIPTSQIAAAHRAALLGWDIGIATATNNQSHANEDNFLIRLYSEQSESSSVIQPTIGLFAVFDGHGQNGHLGSKIASDITRRLSDVAFSNYTEMKALALAQLQQLSMLSGAQLDTLGQSHVVENFVQNTIGEIYQSVNQQILAAQAGGCTMTLIVWDLISRQLYTATAGDSLAYGGDSNLHRVTLISADHGSDNPEQFEASKDAIELYFKGIEPKKYAYHDDITIVWQTPNTSSPHELEESGFIPPSSDEDEDDDSEEELEPTKLVETTTGTPIPTASGTVGSLPPASFIHQKGELKSEEEAMIMRSLLQMNVTGDQMNDKKKDSNSNEETVGTQKSDDVNSGDENSSPLNDQKAFFEMLKKMMALPTINGRRVAPGKVPGWASLTVSKIAYPMNWRLGPIQPARSMGDNPYKGPTIAAASFVRSDPDIKIYNLTQTPFEFLLLSSDGYTNPHMFKTANFIRQTRIENCNFTTTTATTTLSTEIASTTSASSSAPSSSPSSSEKNSLQCLDDPLARLDEWYNNTEIFYQPFLDAHKAFASAIDIELRHRIYESVSQSIARSSTPQQAMESIVAETLKIDQTNTVNMNDDITIIYVARRDASHQSSIKSIQPHIQTPSSPPLKFLSPSSV